LEYLEQGEGNISMCRDCLNVWTRACTGKYLATEAGQVETDRLLAQEDTKDGNQEEKRRIVYGLRMCV